MRYEKMINEIMFKGAHRHMQGRTTSKEEIGGEDG